MNRYIKDDKLRKIVYNFDDIDVDLDNMILAEEYDFSDRHHARMENLLNNDVHSSTYQELPMMYNRCGMFCKAAICLAIAVLFGLSIIHETNPNLDYADRFIAYMMQGLTLFI